jgi:polygalacturonase
VSPAIRSKLFYTSFVLLSSEIANSFKKNILNMNNLKTFLRLSFALTLVMFTYSRSFAQKINIEDPYKGLEFKMMPIKEAVIPLGSVSILDFGAVSGGQTLCTNAFRQAIDALEKKGGGTVVIPRGTWLTGPITLKSNIRLHAEAGALIVFSSDKSLYPLVETSFEGFNTFRCMSPLNGRNLENISITGDGIFDGGGDAWRAVKKEKLTESQWKKLVASGGLVSENGKIWYPSEQFRAGEKMAEMNVPRQLKTKDEFMKIKDFLRPVMISFVSCKNVLLDGPTFQNSPAWCIHPLLCENLIVRNTTVKNPWYSQNGDGIDVESCKNSLVYNCSFDVGDDAICIKSGKDKEGRDRGVPNENMVVKNCVVYHGHGGVTVGSEMSGGVKNLHVSNCTFLGTDVGLRFKSNRGRGGVVENIYISKVEMINIPVQAISFNLYYGGKSPGEADEQSDSKAGQTIFPVSEETPQFKNIFISDVNCKGAFQGIYLQGLPEMNLSNIHLNRIKMEADFGLISIDASGVTISDVVLKTKKFPVLDIINSKNVSIEGLETLEGSLPVIRLSGNRTEKISVRNSKIDHPEQQIKIEKELSKSVIQIN